MEGDDAKKRKKWKPKSYGNFNKQEGKKFSCSSRSVKGIKSLEDYLPNRSSSWTLYLPERYSMDDLSLRNKLAAAKKYLSFYTESMLIHTDKVRWFSVDLESLQKDEKFGEAWETYKLDLDNSSDLVIGLFGLAMEYLITENEVRDAVDSLTNIDGGFYNIRKKINPRFIGLKNILCFQDVKTMNYGKFVTLMGIVVRTSDTKPFCTEMAFSCLKCQTIQVTSQEKGCYTPPNRCIGKDCHAITFKPLLKSPLTQTVPWKTVRLQELNIHQNESGRVPRCVECELMCDLTDTCIPGDIVTISGKLSLNNTNNEKKTTASKDACEYVLYLSANSVTCLKGKNMDSNSNPFHFEIEDLNAITDIHSKENLFQLVVASLAPNIYGHELVKAGIVLALFGGGSSEDDKGSVSTRGNSHVLIVGDPGLGKSQMLLAASSVSPRGVYVCGNSTTASGLTVTISKKSGDDNSMEAGALVLADQGHCCIDEFDKMMHQHSALLEAMEQQTISIAKSGVVCTLPARASIIAAANPTGGHYNKAKTVSENLRIGGSLLSRFDLVFIIQDRPDQAFDSEMTEHVMGLHTAKSKGTISNRNLDSSLPIQSPLNANNKLKCLLNRRINCIPHKMLQRYISYARKYSQPKLTPEVSGVLQNFYLEMRAKNKYSYSTPITIRQLESLIRLTKARARVEMRPCCTLNDAEEVIEIMKYSIMDTCSDEFGFVDSDRSIHGSGMSKLSQAKRLVNLLTKTAATKGDDCFLLAEIKDLAKKAKITADFTTLFDSLNDQGFLLKKGYQLYQLQTL